MNGIVHRIIEFIRGKPFLSHMMSMGVESDLCDHKRYHQYRLPVLLVSNTVCVLSAYRSDEAINLETA